MTKLLLISLISSFSLLGCYTGKEIIKEELCKTPMENGYIIQIGNQDSIRIVSNNFFDPIPITQVVFENGEKKILDFYIIEAHL